MRENKPFYHELLHGEFQRRRAKNPAYSLRAFSKNLGIHPSTLSGVFLRRRRLAFKDALVVAEKLRLDELQKKTLFASLLADEEDFRQAGWPFRGAGIFQTTRPIDESISYKVIAEWEHYALFFLIQTEDFLSEPDWMAQRLGVSRARIEEVVDNLLGGGFIRRGNNGELSLARETLATTDEHASQALRVSHRESLEAAHKALETWGLDERDFTSSVFAIELAQVPQLKKEIRRFYDRLRKYAKKKSRNEVYELCISLFPRTQLRRSKTR